MVVGNNCSFHIRHALKNHQVSSSRGVCSPFQAAKMLLLSMDMTIQNQGLSFNYITSPFELKERMGLRSNAERTMKEFLSFTYYISHTRLLHTAPLLNCFTDKIAGVPYNPRGLSAVCCLPPTESSFLSVAPPAPPPIELVVSETVFPAPLAVFPTPSVTPPRVLPTPFPRPTTR